MTNCKKCNSTKITYVEVMWDYDWALYVECGDCPYKENRYTWNPFTIMKSKEEYGLTYFFWEDWKLNSYSIHNAEWLTVDDDLTLVENTLWGSYGQYPKAPMVYRPIKNMSASHIKSILADGIPIREDVRLYFVNKFANNI